MLIILNYDNDNAPALSLNSAPAATVAFLFTPLAKKVMN
jgi:hypothetical protein